MLGIDVTLKDDNLWDFHNDWEHALAGTNPAPNGDLMETLFRVQVQKSAAMRDIATLPRVFFFFPPPPDRPRGSFVELLYKAILYIEVLCKDPL